MNEDINDFVPSLLNPRCVKKHDISLTQNSIVSRCSLSLKRGNVLSQQNVSDKKLAACNKSTPKNSSKANKENTPIPNFLPEFQFCENVNQIKTCYSQDSIGFSAIKDLQTNYQSSSFSFGDLEDDDLDNVEIVRNIEKDHIDTKEENSIRTSSITKLCEVEAKSESVVEDPKKTLINVTFRIDNCESIDVTSETCAIKRFLVTHNNTSTNVNCEFYETSQISTETTLDENMNETSSSPLKRSEVAVSLEIKKQKLSVTDGKEDAKVLILNTNAIEKISHVIVQPPNYRFVKRNLPKSKFQRSNKSVYNGRSQDLKQLSIDSFFNQTHVAVECIDTDKNDAEEMSRNSGVNDAIKCERTARSAKVLRRESNEGPRSAKLPSKRDAYSPRRDVKTSNSEAPSPRVGSSHSPRISPRKNVEAIHFSLPTAKSKTIKASLSPRNIPHHKIVAGTHFAVDAFSYGDIPNVKHYFLTHFHSDHYSGLKKNFNKLLFCSKITADLCISRLGVNSKHIHVVNVDETLRVDGVEVVAVDANHCPGALMLVFTLPNGKSLLHTGDFRACPPMESYPVFWNRDIHTVYLDTTYCNPRYDFPTQDQSLEMAVYILRQKKMHLEKAGKKFASVLIICGTYIIGKEKFFLGMSRRVGCSVWACPEKERVLQTVERVLQPAESKPATRDLPQDCQLHVVPMRDLTHEKLRCYLDSMQGAFSEVVAFKPSGWENGKNTSVEKDCVTIHGIPYSEHSSFSELIRFVKFLKPKQVVPTVDISGGVKAVQKYFPCPLVYKDEILCQNKVTDYFSIQNRQPAASVT